MPSTVVARRRAWRPPGLVALFAGAAVALVGGCSASPAPAPTTPRPAASAAAVSAAPTGPAMPAPSATITAGPVPPAAAHTAARYWQLVDAHRYRALLNVVTRDSHNAAAVRAGDAAASWGIARVRVVSVDAAASPLPPHGATLEFAMTVVIRPTRTSSWGGGRTLVFMSLRRVGDAWRVYEVGSGP
jgi:hypothetical protein